MFFIFILFYCFNPSYDILLYMRNALAWKMVYLWTGVCIGSVYHTFGGQKKKVVYWDHEMVIASKVQ